MGARRQEGYLYEVEGSNGKPASFHIRYRVNAIVDGKQVRVQRSTKLCDRDAKFHSITGKAVKEKQAQFMLGIKGTSRIAPKEETVEGLWRTVYLPHIEETTKASTSHGYKNLFKKYVCSYDEAGNPSPSLRLH